jgi:hypothetical protein
MATDESVGHWQRWEDQDEAVMLVKEDGTVFFTNLRWLGELGPHERVIRLDDSPKTKDSSKLVELGYRTAQWFLPRRVYSEDFWDLVEAYGERATTGSVWLARLWFAAQFAMVFYACVKSLPKFGERRQKDGR